MNPDSPNATGGGFCAYHSWDGLSATTADTGALYTVEPFPVVTTFDAVYLDVVPGERLVYAYNLLIDERKISVSLATVEIQAAPGGSRLRITEQGAFLDGYEDGGAREHGTRLGMHKIDFVDEIAADVTPADFPPV